MVIMPQSPYSPDLAPVSKTEESYGRYEISYDEAHTKKLYITSVIMSEGRKMMNKQIFFQK